MVGGLLYRVGGTVRSALDKGMVHVGGSQNPSR